MADVPKKEESSQEATTVKEPEADASTRQTVPAVLPQAALGSGSMEVSAAEFAAFREWQEKQAQARQGNAAPPSPPKKQKVEDEEDMQEFQAQLVELDINFADLDPELQSKLKTSKSARKDFLAIHTTDQCYNPADGTWEAQTTAKKRDFGSTVDRSIPNLTAEDNVQQAMLQYHQRSVLPSLDQLHLCCDSFYKMAQHEFSVIQHSLERHASQLNTLERSRANKTILLLDLPPLFNKKSLDTNIGYYLQATGLSWNDIAALHNHMVSSQSAVVRLEFVTETQAQTFRDTMRQGRRYWRDPQSQDCKIRVEQDQPTDDRVAMQPYFALLDVLSELYVEETGQEEHASLQTWRQTLQIWTPRGEEPKTLIGQVSYVLDPRFARRYSCLLLVHDRFYDKFLDRWHDKFSRRLRDTLFLTQALKRATADRTTVQRASFDKAFDLTTAVSPQAFPYTVMPVRISDDLAAMLQSHPMLPFQGAGGMTALTAQAFLDQGYDDYGKGSPKAKGSGKGKSQSKRTDYQDSWKPQMGYQRSTSYQNWSQNQGGWTDYRAPQKGTPKGGTKTQPKGSWKERDRDTRTDWKKQDDDNNDDWGSGWKSWTPSRPSTTPLFSSPSSGKQQSSNTKGQQPNNKGQGKTKIQPVFICATCSCALGFCADCPDCKDHPTPPGFMWKDKVPWQSLKCPCANNSQQLCDKPLGHAQDCPFCQEHRKYWSSKQAQDSWTSLPTPTKCMILQLDRILFDLDPIMQAPDVTSEFIQQMNNICQNTAYPNYSPQQHAAYWVNSVFTADLSSLIPLPKLTRLPWSNPTWEMQEQQIVNMWGPLFDPVLQATFYIASWFAQYFKEIWNKHFDTLTQHYKLGNWARNADISHSPMLPWDRLIASSLWIAYEQAKQEQTNPPDLAWTQQLLEWFLTSSWSRTTTDLFQTLAEEFAWYLQHDETLKACIQATPPYDNKGIGTSAGFGSLFFDAVYWQVAAVYGLLRDAKQSQLQAPNDELVKLLEYILPLIGLSNEEIQAVKWRAHVNKGNIMETIMLAMAENGAHWLTWKTAWAMLQHQHKDTRHPWVQVVSVY